MALVFILPALFGFLVFYLYPTIRGIYFSLTRYNILGSPHFIGIGQLHQARSTTRCSGTR